LREIRRLLVDAIRDLHPRELAAVDHRPTTNAAASLSPVVDLAADPGVLALAAAKPAGSTDDRARNDRDHARNDRDHALAIAIVERENDPARHAVDPLGTRTPLLAREVAVVGRVVAVVGREVAVVGRVVAVVGRVVAVVGREVALVGHVVAIVGGVIAIVGRDPIRLRARSPSLST
jgi:hypothetical protein